MAAKATRARSFAIASLPLALAFLLSDASASGVTYTYDQAGRVATALYDNGLCVNYTYDSTGNRTTQTNGTPGTPSWGSGTWGCFVWTP
jgi:hypothetical protein